MGANRPYTPRLTLPFLKGHLYGNLEMNCRLGILKNKKIKLHSTFGE
jgi:hypothetical protein